MSRIQIESTWNIQYITYKSANFIYGHSPTFGLPNFPIWSGECLWCLPSLQPIYPTSCWHRSNSFACQTCVLCITEILFCKIHDILAQSYEFLSTFKKNLAYAFWNRKNEILLCLHVFKMIVILNVRTRMKINILSIFFDYLRFLKRFIDC